MNAIGTPPSEADIRAALARILASPGFRRAPQVTRFLAYVIENAIRGQAGRLKSYTIGVEALGQPSGFDPDRDPIVRVTGLRLRRSLERYYAGVGAEDELRIALPAGSYRPSIARNAPTVDPPMQQDSLFARVDQAIRQSEMLRAQLVKRMQTAQQLAETRAFRGLRSRPG
jgi:hypothetical protein